MCVKSCFAVEVMARKNLSQSYFEQAGSYLLCIEQQGESAHDVYPPWAPVCLIYMKGILLSSGRRSGGDTFRAAAKGGEGSGAEGERGMLPPSPRPPAAISGRLCLFSTT